METCPGPLPRLAVVSLPHKHPGFFPDTICLTGDDDTRADLDPLTAEKQTFQSRFCSFCQKKRDQIKKEELFCCLQTTL